MKRNANDSKKDVMGEKLLTAREVAERFGVSLRTLETLIKRGNAPVFVWIGNQRRWREDDLAVFLEQKVAGQETQNSGCPDGGSASS